MHFMNNWQPFINKTNSWVLCTWKQLMGKYHYCGISTAIRQNKNPRTSRKQKFNLILCYDILFCSFDLRGWYHNSKIEGLIGIEVFIQYTYLYAKNIM